MTAPAVTREMNKFIALERSSHEDETRRLQWCDWMRQHGMDPNETVTPGFIEVYHSNNNWYARYLAYELNEGGGRFVDPDSYETKAKMVIRTVRLDARPTTFPPGDWKSDKY